jgi:6-pyruvoyltetrahydropterin/6-carboxytetrahydropterin synthase
MMVFKEFRFEAAHWLPMVPEDHKCHRMHGHSYRVRLEIEGEIRADGMVIDFAEIKALWEPLHDQLDHRCLNDEIPNPTVEKLAEWIWGQLDLRLPAVSVTVWETDSCGAVYP